jgi:hypothetical protein
MVVASRSSLSRHRRVFFFLLSFFAYTSGSAPSLAAVSGVPPRRSGSDDWQGVFCWLWHGSKEFLQAYCGQKTVSLLPYIPSLTSPFVYSSPPKSHKYRYRSIITNPWPLLWPETLIPSNHHLPFPKLHPSDEHYLILNYIRFHICAFLTPPRHSALIISYISVRIRVLKADTSSVRGSAATTTPSLHLPFRIAFKSF